MLTLLLYLAFFLCLFSIICLNYFGLSSVSTFYIILKLWIYSKIHGMISKNKLFSVELWFFYWLRHILLWKSSSLHICGLQQTAENFMVKNSKDGVAIQFLPIAFPLKPPLNSPFISLLNLHLLPRFLRQPFIPPNPSLFLPLSFICPQLSRPSQ